MSSSQGEVTLPATRRTRKSIGSGLPTRRTGEKENTTLDLGAAAMAANRKKSRSKSMGPGGLDALKPGTGNRRVSLAIPSRPPPRSILKPTIPLLPEIPPHKPRQSGAFSNFGGSTSNGADNLASPLDAGDHSGGGSGTKVALRTEEEQQAAARERDEREQAEMEKEIKDRREARRKSLANRRVSFAAEATLHTFHEIEDAPESTTSTDATRRASAAAPSPAPRHQEHSDSDASDPPSSPMVEEEELVPDSPENQGEVQLKKRRRSSGAATMNCHNMDDDTLASTIYDSDFEHADSVAEIQGEEMTGSSDDSDSDDGTMMTVDAEEMTSASVGTVHSGFSVDSGGDDLDENLRLAARMAASQGGDDEEEEPSSGERPEEQDAGSDMEIEMDMDMDMDITRAVGGIIRPSKPASPTDVEDEEDMDMSMDVTKVMGGIISKAKPTTRRKSVKPNARQASAEEDQDDDMDMSMDVTRVMGGIISQAKPPTRRKSVEPTMRQPSPDKDQDEDMDMSMEVTRVMGGIISQVKQPPRRRSLKPNTRQAAEDVTTSGEQTMDFTMAVGGIQQRRISAASFADTEINEDMSMELTTAVGSLLSGNIPAASAQNIQQAANIVENEAESEMSLMDMTVAVGRILPADEEGELEQVEDANETMGMDMTMAVGGIIKPPATSQARSMAKKVMELEADAPDPSITASVEIKSPRRRRSSTIVNENGSPELMTFPAEEIHRSPSRSPSHSPTRSPVRAPSRSPSRSLSRNPSRSPTRATSATIASSIRRSASPAKAPSIHLSSSPVKTPASEQKAASASRTPTMNKAPFMIGSRSNSPMRQPSPQTMTTPRSPPKSPTKSRLFHQDPNTGASTPRIVLTPQRRRLSGVGADRSGLGSPRVVEILDRRESIGDAAATFSPFETALVRRAVAFADPRAMEVEIDRERRIEEEKENSRSILEREADGFEATLNLREMIQGLSPKKSLFRGRKSLHVGSARGLLGKRPLELDDEEEAEEQDGIKRLKGHQGSPVKNVKLQSPPTKAETTTGRKARSANRNLENADDDTVTPTTIMSPKKATTPRGQGRFVNFSDDQPTDTMDFGQTVSIDEDEMQEDDGGERIHLQDFLNMTSIRFMELTTTKRRHTVAPSAPRDSTAASGKEDVSFEECVVAGACTVPMLELYQHSCRELKKYISEGRRIVRDIESETFEENPPLFREYLTASPEFKVLMDNQFKNVKSHARLLSKAMWYEWRTKLQEGLKEGLIKISEGMDEDDALLQKQQELLSSVLPAMLKQFEALEQEHDDLEAVARELADCDPADLAAARGELVSLDKDIADKTKKIAELRRQLSESESGIESSTARKQLCLDEIKEADKVREECRGWSSTEISALKARVDALEKQHGWAITGISGTVMSMSYKREAELVFDPASFQQQSKQQSPQQQQDSRSIDLWYIAANRERNPLPSTPEKEFFLQCIRNHVRALNRSTTRVSRLLGIVSAAWEKANAVATHVRLLNLTFPTTVNKTSDTSITVSSSLLLVPLQTRIEVMLRLQSVAGDGDGVEVAVTPDARVVYGEPFNVGKMVEFLANRLGGRVAGSVKNGGDDGKLMSWNDAVLELHKRLLAKGAKVGQGK
ncbi:hypothetical protein B0T17DRAFT_527566 [Bombardia bombarda]|uniref:Spc7 kinetochore protein domain-containing protein n=1 Tax=Bombardia bombarda TaxID=252184 RepID=A0AA40C9H4_9PEZI|nr:hypothetical protein B0T17DRAFT_527566 [Bombardia bombarda]